MRHVHVLLTHLLVPCIVAVWGLIATWRAEPLTAELVRAHLLWLPLFYAAPHLAWALLVATLKPSRGIWHAGFISSSCTLLVICALSLFGPRDRTGLPHQWLMYWPVAALFLVAIVGYWRLFSTRSHTQT